MDSHRGEEVQRLVRSDPVVEVTEALHLFGEHLGIGDLLAVEVLVLLELRLSVQGVPRFRSV